MLRVYGHSYEFDDAQPDPGPKDIPAKEDANGVMRGGTKRENAEIRVRIQSDTEGLEELPVGDDMISTRPPGEILKWLSSVYQTSRGLELGTFDGSLLAMAMKTQSAKWEPIAFGYIKD